MPTQPMWFHRLEEILEELRALEISHLDRLAVQRLFRVRERRARQIMAGLPALQVGNAVAIEREALIARLWITFYGTIFGSVPDGPLVVSGSGDQWNGKPG